MIELFSIGKVNVYILNIVLVAATITLVFFARKWTKKNLLNFLEKRDWSTINEDKLVKLILQIIYILGFAMIYRSLAVYNPVISVKNILAINVFDFRTEGIVDVKKTMKCIHLTVCKILTIVVIHFIAK